MSLPSEILIDLFPALALIVLLANAKVGLPYSRANRVFVIAIGLVVAALCFDMVYELLKGETSRIAWWAQWAASLGYFSAVGPVAFCWLLFVCGSIRDDGELLPRGWKGVAATVPVLVYCVLVVAVFWTQAVFSIEPDIGRVRESLFLSSFVFGLGYVAAVAVRALRQRRISADADVCRRCKTLVFVPVPIACAVFVGWLLGDFALTIQGIAVSIVFVYFALQRERVSRDGLTGLNNRRRFDRYFAEKCSSGNGGKPWVLAIIDIDGFKAINDTYGHVVGDQVLKRVAEGLKRVFGKKKAFIARYGGDEFVVVLDGESQREAEACMKSLGALLASAEHKADRVPVSFSVGYVTSDYDGAVSPDELVAKADRMMYSAKRTEKRS